MDASEDKTKHTMNKTNIKESNLKVDKLVLANLNIQSITNKIDLLRVKVQNERVDILCITEHWLAAENLQSPNIDGYDIISGYCRGSTIHGGSMILLRNELHHEKINLGDMAVDFSFEASAAYIKELEAILLCVYRAPSSNVKDFFDRMETALQYLLNKGKEIIVAGDFNICTQQDDGIANEWKTVLEEYGLRPVFREPSRVEGNRCIDNICISHQVVNQVAITTNWHLGDHLTQMLQLPKMKETTYNRNYEMVRMQNERTMEKFAQLIEEANWDEIYYPGISAQVCYSKFHQVFHAAFEKACPLVSRRKGVEKPKYRESSQTKKLKEQLDAVYTVIKATKQYQYMQLYRELKQQYRKIIEELTREENSKYIIEADNKIKATWKLIKQEVPGKINQKRTEVETSLTSDDLNSFFSKVGIYDGNTSKEDPISIVKGTNKHSSMFLYQTNKDEVEQTIKRLKNKHTRDVYGTSPYVLKRVNTQVSGYLSHVINRCIDEGIFPTELKNSKVVPVFKKGDKDSEENYRPISIIPTIAKVFEAILAKRIRNYLLKEKAFTNDQHGYLPGRSTTTALRQMISQIHEAFDGREYAQVAFCDLSRAFDTVDHATLVGKLEKYGVRGGVRDLLRDYLMNRMQVVEWRGVISQPVPIKNGIPQGSLLGPLLFLVYTNDLPENVQAKSITIYADDTSMLSSGMNMEELKTGTNNSLTQAMEWFSKNRMRMNESKTEIMTFYTRRTKEVRGKTTKFLGVQLSETLDWAPHVEQTKKRLATALYGLRRVRSSLSEVAARAVYFAYFHSIASYAVEVWGLSRAASGIFKLQKKAIRILFGLGVRESCREYFRRAGILTLPSCCVLALLVRVHRERQDRVRNSDRHEYATRGANDLVVPWNRTNKTQREGDHMEVSLYNGLCAEVKSLSEGAFRSRVRVGLVRGAYYSVEEFRGACAEGTVGM